MSRKFEADNKLTMETSNNCLLSGNFALPSHLCITVSSCDVSFDASTLGYPEGQGRYQAFGSTVPVFDFVRFDETFADFGSPSVTS